MAKKAKKRVTKKAPIYQRHSRLERETRLEKALLWGVVVVAVLVVGIVSYGLVYEKVIKARRPVAIVDGVPITTAEFQARVSYEQKQLELELDRIRSYQSSLDPEAPESEFLLQQINSSISNLQSRLIMAENTAYEQLIREELVRQEAVRRDVAITPEELQREIELRYFGYDRNPVDPTPAPTATPVLTATEAATPAPTAVPPPTPTPMTEESFRQEYKRVLREFLRPLGVSESMFRSWFEADLLTDKLRDKIGEEVPFTADQVQLRYLTVDSEERANELAARLDDGEDFQILADELEAEEEPTGFSGELSWYPRDVLEQMLTSLGAELIDQAFSLAVGEHSQPVANEESARYTIIEVMGHEDRELGEEMRQQLTDEAFREWLEGEQVKIERIEYAKAVPAEQ
jgi:parvulin-like peptidyl-prolyl isomerase